MVHFLHRLYGVDAPEHKTGLKKPDSDLHGEILLDKSYDGVLEIHAGGDWSLGYTGDALSTVRPHPCQRLILTIVTQHTTQSLPRLPGSLRLCWLA